MYIYFVIFCFDPKFEPVMHELLNVIQNCTTIIATTNSPKKNNRYFCITPIT